MYSAAGQCIVSILQRGGGRCDTTQVAAALGPRQCQCRVVPVLVQSSASAEWEERDTPQQ